jgi:hypothetical protein
LLGGLVDLCSGGGELGGLVVHAGREHALLIERANLLLLQEEVTHEICINTTRIRKISVGTASGDCVPQGLPVDRHRPVPLCAGDEYAST